MKTLKWLWFIILTTLGFKLYKFAMWALPSLTPRALYVASAATVLELIWRASSSLMTAFNGAGAKADSKNARKHCGPTHLVNCSFPPTTIEAVAQPQALL